VALSFHSLEPLLLRPAGKTWNLACAPGLDGLTPDVTTIDEALFKILCHNLCCLGQSAYELGIAWKFWQKDHSMASRNHEAYDEIDAMAWI
jgi:hypothetical protein